MSVTQTEIINMVDKIKDATKNCIDSFQTFLKEWDFVYKKLDEIFENSEMEEKLNILTENFENYDATFQDSIESLQSLQNDLNEF